MQSQVIGAHPASREVSLQSPGRGQEHTQWSWAFYLEVVTFHPQDTELGVQRRKKVLLPFAIWVSVLEAATTVT